MCFINSKNKLNSLFTRKSSLSNLIGAGNITNVIATLRTQASPIVFHALTRTNKTVQLRGNIGTSSKLRYPYSLKPPSLFGFGMTQLTVT
jgi:hypothetical protein